MIDYRPRLIPLKRLTEASRIQEASALSAAGVNGSTVPILGAGAGSTPSAALHDLRVSLISPLIAKMLLEKEHYLHSMPGGTILNFGVFHKGRLMGALTFGAGPALAYRLVEGSKRDDCLALTRLWLSDELPTNSESRVLGFVLHSLRQHTSVKFLVSYADPTQGHVGTIYQATGWVYSGLSSAMPLYDLGDGVPRHSRSLAHSYGSHSLRYFAGHGVDIKLIPQSAKHRYIYFLDASLRSHLKAPILPYPKKENSKENNHEDC